MIITSTARKMAYFGMDFFLVPILFWDLISYDYNVLL